MHGACIVTQVEDVFPPAVERSKMASAPDGPASNLDAYYCLVFERADFTLAEFLTRNRFRMDAIVRQVSGTSPCTQLWYIQ